VGSSVSYGRQRVNIGACEEAALMAASCSLPAIFSALGCLNAISNPSLCDLHRLSRRAHDGQRRRRRGVWRRRGASLTAGAIMCGRAARRRGTPCACGEKPRGGGGVASLHLGYFAKQRNAIVTVAATRPELVRREDSCSARAILEISVTTNVKCV